MKNIFLITLCALLLPLGNNKNIILNVDIKSNQIEISTKKINKNSIDIEFIEGYKYNFKYGKQLGICKII